MEKLITISIANYNNANKLDASISSLLDERITDLIEVVVVNDGSKDNSIEVIDKYVKKYPNTVKCIDKENGGYGSTINASLKVATGKYYRLLDADDAYYTENFAAFVKQLKEIDVDLIYTDFAFVNISNNNKEKITFDFPKKQILNVNVIKQSRMHAATVKTELIKNKISITEHCFYTDLEFMVKSINECNTFMYIPLEIYKYNIGDNEQSVSKTGYIKHNNEHERILKTILPIVHGNEKFTTLIDNHLGELAAEQLFYYLFDKKFHDDFFNYAKWLKKNYPEYMKYARKKVRLILKCKPLYYLFIER